MIVTIFSWDRAWKIEFIRDYGRKRIFFLNKTRKQKHIPLPVYNVQSEVSSFPVILVETNVMLHVEQKLQD